MIAPMLRRVLLATVFLTAVVSAAFLPGDEQPAKRATKAKAAPGAVPQETRVARARDIEVPALLNYRRELGEGVKVVDVFESRIPPGAVVAPPKPVAPPLPFAFAGIIE